MDKVPAIAKSAVLQVSGTLEGHQIVRGYDQWEKPVDYDELFASLERSGYQATSMGQAIKEIRRMLDWRLSQEEPSEDDKDEWKDPAVRANTRCTIFLGYTSNLISSGLRETLCFLTKHKLVSAIVTTAGGVEEDFIKCLAPTYMGEFTLEGKTLRERGINRIGNLLVPNDNYCKFEDWIMPIFDKMAQEQQKDGVVWSPSTMIARLGKEINNESSVYYWAYKNDIPVFCPAITDGSLGDMLYFHSYHADVPLVVDIVRDIRKLNDISVRAPKSGMLILGAGVVKHHICNANLMRNGADFSVYINTANEFDGSDAGARPDEAVSWGKIKAEATPVKIYGDASLIFPLIVAQTFAKEYQKRKAAEQQH